MDIQQLITEARDRQKAQIDAWREQAWQDAQEAANVFQEDFCRTFGADLFAALGAQSSCGFKESAVITFAYQARDYAVRCHSYEGTNEWALTRLDPRADDDERPRPRVQFTEYRRDTQHNIDSLVLALSDLDQEPDVPMPKTTTIEPITSDVSEQGAALLEALRVFLQSEL